MDRDIPNFNRTVMQRIYAKNQELHLKRLKNIRSGISSNKSYNKQNLTQLNNSKANLTTNYAKLPQYNNLKKQVIQDSKNTQIQRENALLFQKMMRIMKRPDRNNDPQINKPRGSTNIAKQRLSMEFTRINEQNRALYYRLQQQKPTIDNKKLEQQRLRNLNILKFLGKYPNQQAITRATQYKTFDLRSKRMNSTSNRVYYNNVPSHSYEDGTDAQQNNDSYARFRNQMMEYDNQINELKIQQQNGRQTQDKFNLTAANYHNKGAQNQKNTQQGRSNEINQMNVYQPVPPSRRKFLSQGANRKVIQQQKFNVKQEEFQQFNHQSFQHHNTHDQQPYPYRLNHPSHNIIIQDRHTYNQVKRNTIENKQYRPTNTSTINSGNMQKSFLPSQQRRLNSKNSIGNLMPSQEKSMNTKNNLLPPQERSMRVNYDNKFQSFLKQENDSQSQPYPKFSQRKQARSIQANHNRNQHQSNDEHNNNLYAAKQSNLILLYKSVIPLNQLLVDEQKNQLLKDIFSDIQHNDHSQLITTMQNLKSALSQVFLQYSPQVSIYRLPDCYKISIQNKSNNKNMFKTKKHPSMSKKNFTSQNTENKNIINQQTLDLINLLVQRKLDEIRQVEIPQVEGSLLLQEIDYDYKYFISQMVKVEKDSECEQMGEQISCYRVVIVLKDDQQEDKVQQEQHNVQVQKDENLEKDQNSQQQQLNRSHCSQCCDQHKEGNEEQSLGEQMLQAPEVLVQQTQNENQFIEPSKEEDLAQKELDKEIDRQQVNNQNKEDQKLQGNDQRNNQKQQLPIEANTQKIVIDLHQSNNANLNQDTSNYLQALDQEVL